MKKAILYAFGLCALLACSSSPRSKAEQAVKNFLREEIGAKYSPVSFGELDSIVVDLTTDKDYLKLKKTVDFYASLIDSLRRTTSSENEAMLAGATARHDKEKKELDQFLAKFKPGFIGYKLGHAYKEPSESGVLVIEEEIFFVSPDFKKVDYYGVFLID